MKCSSEFQTVIKETGYYYKYTWLGPELPDLVEVDVIEVFQHPKDKDFYHFTDGGDCFNVDEPNDGVMYQRLPEPDKEELIAKMTK